MEGFQPINFNKPVVNNMNSVRKTKSRRQFGLLGKVILGLLAVFVIFCVLLIVFGRESYSWAQKAAVSGKEAYAAVKKQDLETTNAKLKETENNLSQLKNSLGKLAWVKYIPLIGVYESDGEHLVNASLEGVRAGGVSVEAIIPYSDLLGFKGKSTFVAGSADDRIKMAVQTLDKVTPRVNEIGGHLDLAGKELDQVDPNRYPSKIGSMEVKGSLVRVKDIFSQTAKLFVDAQPLLIKIPELMGNKSPKTYLALFQNDAELRATGGFITGYALFKVDNGKVQVIKSDDIYKLDEAKTKTFPAPPPILKYHQNVFTFELRDSNISPDYLVSMQQFEKMLKDSVPDFPAYDGIIAVDTHVLVSAIKILGDFNISGRNFSAANDPRCDCPKAIYELEDYSTKPVAYLRAERKDIIGSLLYQIMQRSLGVSPSKYWGKLFQMFLDEAKQKHILFYFHDNQAQKGIEAMNFGGRVQPYSGDYLLINDVNFAGAKSNLFVKEAVKDEINTDGNGTVTETLTIDYKNPQPPSNCNLEAGQLCLNGILRNWLRIYVPKGSTLVNFSGSEKDTVTYDELDKTVLEGFLTVKPEGASQVKVTYRLPFKIHGGDMYNLLIQKQPGTDNHQYTVIYNGKQIDSFPLLLDKNISLRG